MQNLSSHFGNFSCSLYWGVLPVWWTICLPSWMPEPIAICWVKTRASKYMTCFSNTTYLFSVQHVFSFLKFFKWNLFKNWNIDIGKWVSKNISSTLSIWKQTESQLMLYLQLMSLMPRIHLLFPLTLVRSFWSDVMDSAQSFITSSWTFYLQADDGKIVIFQVPAFLLRCPGCWILICAPSSLRKWSWVAVRSVEFLVAFCCI